ncbi:MAG: helix-turn-helix domain-containing protein [Anderseniella sp.]|nr:helix-turn-helix domain-containing protein [Anderseniella sp.]
MTPFGAKVRELRKQRKVSMKDMADAIGVTPAYLSALEHGHRGLPSWYLVQRIIAYFNVIWDEAEEITRLARLSHPRVVVDTSGLSPAATELANKLADNIASMSDEEIGRHLTLLEEALAKKPASRE